MINKIYKTIGITWIFLSVISLFSCEDDLKDPSFNTTNTLELTVSNEEILLEELFFNNSLNFNWTTGSNQETGAAIKYILELDLADGDFSNPIAIFVENAQNTFSYDVKFGDLNNYLLNYGLDTDQTYILSAKVTAVVTDENVNSQAALVQFNVTTFKPVSDQLFIVGDSTPNGWDITNSTELTASTSERGVFLYKGPLTIGNFKFTESQNDCWCQDFYTSDADDASKIIYNEGGSGNDLQWTIEEDLNAEEEYLITIDILNKTILIEIVVVTPDTPPFETLWIVGDASESGWNIDSPVSFFQNDNNPFEFSYEGQLNPGNFKIFAGVLGDWCGEWYKPFVDNQILEDGTVDQISGCDSDNKWIVTEDSSARYKITVDTKNNTIAFNKVSLYIIGDGGPNGWDIGNPTAMDYINGEYVFVGELGADNATGEFKISKFTGGWCDGDWINAATGSQSINDTSFITTVGCDGPDNKWALIDGQAGTYEIRINLDTQIMTIILQ